MFQSCHSMLFLILCFNTMPPCVLDTCTQFLSYATLFTRYLYYDVSILCRPMYQIIVLCFNTYMPLYVLDTCTMFKSNAALYNRYLYYILVTCPMFQYYAVLCTRYLFYASLLPSYVQDTCTIFHYYSCPYILDICTIFQFYTVLCIVVKQQVQIHYYIQ